jgi:hypothetical protein
VLPVDNQKMLNFLNFNDIGATTSNKSTAFKKIRLNSKSFSTNLIYTPSPFFNRYNMINKLLTNESKFTDSVNYGLKRQHNLTAHTALNCNNINFLDSNSFNKFLDHSCHFNNKQNDTVFIYENPSLVTKKTTSTIDTSLLSSKDLLDNTNRLGTTMTNNSDQLNFLQLDIDSNTN